MAELLATVFDLPHVAAIAAGKIAETGLTERIETACGSFLDHLPADHDLHLLSMILHDWDEAKDRAVLRGLPSGGAVVISELLVNDEKTGPAPAALMSLNMLIETEGRNYTQPNTRRGSRKPDSGTSRRSGSTHPPRTAP